MLATLTFQCQFNKIKNDDKVTWKTMNTIWFEWLRWFLWHNKHFSLFSAKSPLNTYI